MNYIDASRLAVGTAATKPTALGRPARDRTGDAQGHSARVAPAKDQRDAVPGAQPWRHAPRAGLARSQRPPWRRAALHKSSAMRAKLRL